MDIQFYEYQSFVRYYDLLRRIRENRHIAFHLVSIKGFSFLPV